MPIRWRLTLWYSIILMFVLFLFGSYIYLFFAHRETADFDQKLASTGKEVIQSIQVIDTFPFPLQKIYLPNMDAFSSPGIFLQVIDTHGNIVSRSRNLGDQSLPLGSLSLWHVSEGGGYFETLSVAKVKLRIYNLPLTVNGQLMGMLQVGGTLHEMEESLRNLGLLLLVGGLFTILAAGGTGWFLARRALYPINDVVAAAREIQKVRDLERRIPYHGPPDELGRLIQQFNEMLSRLEIAYTELDDSYQMQKKFVSDVSHELRTPLTSIRGNIDFLRKAYHDDFEISKEVLEETSAELDRLTRLLNDLLSLARADAGYRMEMSEIHVAKFMQELLPQIEGLKRSVHFDIDLNKLPEDLIVWGNQDFLKQLFYILLENAFKYTDRGKVALSLSVSDTTDCLIIRVEDTGIGIPQADLLHIFERFYRGSNTQLLSGTGLGLSVAKWIVDRHHGDIQVNSHDEEGRSGTEMIVSLPVKR